MCIACYKKNADMAAAIEEAKPKAKAHAIEKGYNVYLYEEVDGSIHFMEAEVAKKAGIEPLDIISYLQ